MSLGWSGNTGSPNSASSTSPSPLNEDNLPVARSTTLPSTLNEDTAPVDTSTIVPNTSKDNDPSVATSTISPSISNDIPPFESSSVSIMDFTGDSLLIETPAMAKIDPVRDPLMCPGIWKGGSTSISPTNSKDGSNFDVSPIEPLSNPTGDAEYFKIDPRKFTHDDVTEILSMVPRKLDGDGLFFTVSWTAPSGSKEDSAVELSPISKYPAMASITIPSDLRNESPVQVLSKSASASHRNDTPVEPPTISPPTSNNPISPPVKDSPVPHRLPKDFLETLKSHGAAYIVDNDDTISITWLSCPTTVPDSSSNTTTSKAISSPSLIFETLLPASQIMLYDDSTSKPLSYLLGPSNEEMEYNTWLWVKAELDDYFHPHTNQVTKTTLWSTYNPCHHAHDAEKLPSWALTVVFNYRDDLGCRVVYYPPSVRDSKGCWDFSGLDGKREDAEELNTPEIVKEAVEMLVAPFYHGSKGVSGVSG
jgi:hypothetical protein